LQIRENTKRLTGLAAVASLNRGLKEEDAAIAFDNRKSEEGLWGAQRKEAEPSEDEDMAGMVGGDNLENVTINVNYGQPQQPTQSPAPQPAQKPVSQPTEEDEEEDEMVGHPLPAQKPVSQPTSALKKAAIVGALLVGGAGAGALAASALSGSSGASVNIENSGEPDTDTITIGRPTVTD